jgi:hypothetical protein
MSPGAASAAARGVVTGAHPQQEEAAAWGLPARGRWAARVALVAVAERMGLRLMAPRRPPLWLATTGRWVALLVVALAGSAP